MQKHHRPLVIIIRRSQVWLRQRGKEDSRKKKSIPFWKMWIREPHEENVLFSSEYFKKWNHLPLAASSFSIWRRAKIKKAHGPLALACLWPSAGVNWDGKEKGPDPLLHDYSAHSYPFSHHYEISELTIKKDWIYETPHNSNKSQRTITFWIQIFFYRVCVCSAVLEARSLTLSHPILPTTLRGKQAWLPSIVMEKRIETLRDLRFHPLLPG